MTLVNALFIAAVITANAHHQVFCRPVLWAAIIMSIAFLPVMFLPLIRKGPSRWHPLILFLLGIAACICVYCIVFLREMNILALFTWLSPFGRPLAARLTFVPHFFLLQIILFAFHTAGSKSLWKFFAAGVTFSAAYAITMAMWFNLHYAPIRTAWTSGAATGIPRNYMTERMLGMHFKYHMSFCLYDGWRPPLHDPSIVVAVWLTAVFRSDIDSRGFAPDGYEKPLTANIAMYKAVFPGLPARMECSCAKGYRKFYMNDPRLR